MLAKAFGWNAVLGLACIPLSIVFVLYMLMAKDAPHAPAPKKLVDYFQPRSHLPNDGMRRVKSGRLSL